MPDTTARDFRAYLLHRLPEAERDAVEMRLLTDDDAYRAMLAEEDDLLDAYVRGELAAADRLSFEEHLLTRTGVAERVAFARTLQAYGEEMAAAEREPWSARLAAWLATLVPAPAPALRLATAALAVLLLAVTGWFAVRTGELNRQVAQLRTERSELAAERDDLEARQKRLAGELAAARAAAADRRSGAEELARARADELAEELAALSRQQPRREPVAVSFLLALATRGAGTPELVVPPAADVVRLQLDTAGDDDYYDAFRVRLLGPGGAQVWSRTGLAADATTGTVDVEVAAELIPAGHYEVLLEGVGDAAAAELVGAYEFDVKR